MKALAVGLIAGAALCDVISAVPASAMPKSNLATAASDLALGQSVRYVRHHYRYRSRYHGGYGTGCRGFAPSSPSSPCYP
jgi:hypothetical protein